MTSLNPDTGSLPVVPDADARRIISTVAATAITSQPRLATGPMLRVAPWADQLPPAVFRSVIAQIERGMAHPDPDEQIRLVSEALQHGADVAARFGASTPTPPASVAAASAAAEPSPPSVAAMPDDEAAAPTQPDTATPEQPVAAAPEPLDAAPAEQPEMTAPATADAPATGAVVDQRSRRRGSRPTPWWRRWFQPTQ
ncbi:hypothetical protein KEM60_00863 [Austwickia sp. TVS 96-490-7B]|uniref:hypothetical protein n=1 Tax=Austwickia sp. TVS 96-490-7B TaxID=2830843 RepID=UPI001C5779E5|nr:hypothetical protein [Austwickia sp. TVS 96-490-7B]MBW3084674.1 hypothetical protein [Austwickia sp. TVS 96-490-7B]